MVYTAWTNRITDLSMQGTGPPNTITKMIISYILTVHIASYTYSKELLRLKLLQIWIVR